MLTSCTPSCVQIHGVKKCDTFGMILIKQLHQFVTLLSIICKTPYKHFIAQ